MNPFESLGKGPIREGFFKLDDYINGVCNDPISAKSSSFYSNLSEIIFLIFGDEKEQGWLEKSYSEVLDAERQRNSHKFDEKMENMNNLIHLLSPKPQRGYNLFTLLLESVGDHRYELNESKYPSYIRYIINSRIQDPVLNEYKNFSKPSGYPMKEIFNKFDIVLSPFDFYLFVFVYSIKKYKKKLEEPRHAKDLDYTGLVQQACMNPYLILLRRYMAFFTSSHYSIQHKSHFRTLSFLIEEYLINDVIRPVPHPITKIISKEVPYPHVFHAVTIWIHYLNKIIRSGYDNDYISSLAQLNYQAQSKYTKLIYRYLMYCLKIWNKDINNPSNLADLGYVWLTYIRFWSSINKKNYIEVLNFQEGSDQGLETLMRNVEKEFQESFDKDGEILENKEYNNLLDSFIFRNLLFFTAVLKEFLSVFAESNTYNFRNVMFLKKVIDLFFPEGKAFLYEKINQDIPENFQRTNKNKIYFEVVKKHLIDLEADNSDLYFNRDEALNGRLKKLNKKKNEMIDKFYREHARVEFKEISMIFEKCVLNITNVLEARFHTRDMDERAHQDKSESVYYDGIRTSFATYRKVRNYQPVNDWLRRPGSNDFFEVYLIVFWIAKSFDKYILRRDTEKEDYCPVLPLRNVARKSNFLALVLLFVFIYIMMRK